MHPDPKVRNGVRKVIRECRQLIRDVEWWNRNRTDAPPMDCEGQKLLLAVALKAEAETDLKKFGELSAEMIRLASRAVDERDEAGNLRHE